MNGVGAGAVVAFDKSSAFDTETALLSCEIRTAATIAAVKIATQAVAPIKTFRRSRNGVVSTWGVVMKDERRRKKVCFVVTGRQKDLTSLRLRAQQAKIIMTINTF